jgi:hypothetical protein
MSKIDKVFTIVTVTLLCLAFLQLTSTGFPFAGVSCLLVALGFILVARSEWNRTK